MLVRGVRNVEQAPKPGNLQTDDHKGWGAIVINIQDFALLLLDSEE